MKRVLGWSAVVVAATATALVTMEVRAQTLSSIVVDHATGAVLSEDKADMPAYPASLTKMMTLYLTFEALRAGRIALNTPLFVSPEAAAQPPSKLGLKPGSTIKVDDAIRALAVKSANDVARVVAENLAGSEPRFAQLMTYRARELGMTRTRFVNASGLPDEEQRSTARDMATLARRLITDFPEYYHYFGLPYFVWKGRTLHNHNRLLATYDGMDGLKTGYTRASGYNLAASAVRDGRRLVAVVLGGTTSGERNREMVRLLDEGFATRPGGSAPLLAAATSGGPAKSASSASASSAGARALVRASRSAEERFAVALGTFRDRHKAVAHSRRVAGQIPALRKGEPAVGSAGSRSRRFAAQIVGLSRKDALAACSIMRKSRLPCAVIQIEDRAIGSD